MIFQEDFEQTRFLEQDLTFLSAKTEFDESNIPFKEKNLGIQNQDGLYTNLDLLLSDQCKDVQDTFNLSQTTCGRILSRMKEEGQISQHGKGKNTFYILNEKKWLFTSLYL